MVISMEIIGLLGQVLAVALSVLFLINTAVDASRDRSRRRRAASRTRHVDTGLYASALVLLTQATAVRLNLEKLEAELRCRQ